jgi:ligand-binding sensor domain-containing protein
VGRQLNKVNLNEKGFGLKRNDPDNFNSLNSNEVTSIVEDTSAVIWIGTNARGLNRWDRKTNQFSHFRHHPNNSKTLRYDVVQAMLLDKEGNLWVCNGDVLSLFNKQTGGFTHYMSNETKFDEEKHTLISITEDREGLLWLGTLGNGIVCFDKKTRKFLQYYYYNETDSSGISDYTAIAIFADSKDNIWIGHGSIATDRYNKITGKFTHYNHNVRMQPASVLIS